MRTSKRALPAVCVLVLAGCGSTTSAPSQDTASSALSGTLDFASFPSAPSAIEAIDEAGTHVAGKLDANGAFQLALVKGHTYRISVSIGTQTEPVVFPRGKSRLDTTIKVQGGSAVIDLGKVRHLASAPAEGFDVPEAHESCEGDNGNDGECENGVDAKTGAACTDPKDGESEDADPTKPMAVPEHAAPDAVQGCANDGDEAD